MKLTNDNYQQFNGTGMYYKYLFGFVLTDGVKAVAEKEEVFWFLDVICSVMRRDLKAWYLVKTGDSSAVVYGTDGNTIPLDYHHEKGYFLKENHQDLEYAYKQEIPFTDFEDDVLFFFQSDNVIYLPSEH